MNPNSRWSFLPPWWYWLILAAISFLAGFVGARAAKSQRPVSYTVLQSAYVASATFDLAATLYYYPRCRPACQEANPVLGPALRKGVLPGALVGIAMTAGTVWVGDQLYRHPTTRKLWWLVPVVGTVEHSVAGYLNIRMMR